MKELLERMAGAGHSPDAQAQNMAEFAQRVLAHPEIVAALQAVEPRASPADA